MLSFESRTTTDFHNNRDGRDGKNELDNLSIMSLLLGRRSTHIFDKSDPQERILVQSEQGRHERNLINDLFKEYNYLERPVEQESDALKLEFSLALQQIIDVDEKNQYLTTSIWLTYAWTDYNLKWNSSEYGGVQSIRLPAKKVWTPDVLMYNSADEDIDSKFPTNVVVYSSGLCNWIPPGIYISSCKINIRWFPFDDQLCTMKFGSWTYDGSKINLTLLGTAGNTGEGDISTYQPSGEWDLIGVSGIRNVEKYDCCPDPYLDITYTINIRRRKLYYIFNLAIPCFLLSSLTLLCFYLPPDSGEKLTFGVTAIRNIEKYECCPEPYIDITFTVHIRRRVLYYAFNLIIPCALLSSMALLTFSLPPDSGEKISLGVTILLSLTVFLMIVAETMPATSDAVPLIGIYFACIMMVCSLSVVFTVLVLNYHHRNPETHNMPKAVRVIICKWLAWMLRMERPGHDITIRKIVHDARIAKLKEVELRQKSSRSLLANVLDLDDDLCKIDRMDRMNSVPNYASIKIEENGTHIGYTPLANSPTGGHCLHKSELNAILRELKVMNRKTKENDKYTSEANDWKFAARVIDRLCIWIFSIFTLGSTLGIFLSAPNLFS
ncbi:unnamed protein product [Owenia fusiformis]|uniref:Uncharacterized protein n=1 Tax=Owenia fusiformis TaxID=6347 RepID=A0A8J1XUL0_OWEFU|nr:unnamed protein product [Owenia fusiformis]